MVESAPRLNALRTGETTRNANTAECLGYGTVETGSGVNEIGAKKLAKRRLAPRLNVLRTGETTRNANTAECLGYGTVETGSGVNEIGALIEVRSTGVRSQPCWFRE